MDTASLLQKDSKGDILISLEYLPKQCVLEGMILKVTNLEKQDVSGLAGFKHIEYPPKSPTHTKYDLSHYIVTTFLAIFKAYKPHQQVL